MNKNFFLKKINKMNENTLMNVLNIKYIDINYSFLISKMEIKKYMFQISGFLHGGAIATLAESTGSMFSLYINNFNDLFKIFGVDMSINYINYKIKGVLFAKASMIHKSKRTHLIKVKIYDENNKFISYCKMTNIIIPKSEKN